MTDLAREIEVPYSTLQNWCYKGWIHTRRAASKGKKRVVWANKDEIDRIRRLRDHLLPQRRIAAPQNSLTSPRRRRQHHRCPAIRRPGRHGDDGPRRTGVAAGLGRYVGQDPAQRDLASSAETGGCLSHTSWADTHSAHRSQPSM